MTDNEIIEALKRCGYHKECCSCNSVEECGSKRVLVANALDLINRQKAEIERLGKENDHLLNVARKMHTWIFLNTGDEQTAYDEMGLSDEDNALLGYGGRIELTVESEESK